LTKITIVKLNILQYYSIYFVLKILILVIAWKDHSQHFKTCCTGILFSSLIPLTGQAKVLILPMSKFDHDMVIWTCHIFV